MQSTNLESEPLWYSEDLLAEILLPQGRRANLCDLSSCCNATASPGPSFPLWSAHHFVSWLSPLCRDLVCTILQKTLTAPPSPGWVCISCTTPEYFDIKGSISSLSRRPLKCFDSSHRRGGESQQERRALSQEVRSPPSPRALCRSKAGCSPREGAASCGSQAGRRNLVPRSQVVPVLFLTKQLVGVVSGVAPRLLPVHAHLFQPRHNRLYNEVLQKKWSKILCRNFFENLLSKHFFVRPGFAAMSSQSHSLTTETEPDAEKPCLHSLPFGRYW